MLWHKYYKRRQEVDDDMVSAGVAKQPGAGIGNELWLLHGTRSNDPEKIWSDHAGVDFRLSNSSGGLFGRAAYFAEKSAYSDVYAYTVPTAPHTAQMFVVRVAAGKIEQKPPGPYPRPSPGYHSIRGCVKEPGESLR